MTQTTPHRFLPLPSALLLAASLVGCGGGSGAASTSTADSASTPPVTNPAGTPGPATGASTPVAPGAPTGVAATFAANAATLRFTAPASTGSSAIARYTARCSDGVHHFVGSAAASPVTVSGLVQQVAYTCVVRAANAELDGVDSATVAVTLPAAPLALAGAPQSVAATAGNGSITLAFSPPATDGGYPVVGYHAVCTAAGQGPGQGHGVASPVVVPGMRNGVAASCTVAAINARGEGPPSAAVGATPSATAPGPVAPGAPTGVTAAAGNGFVRLAFTAPASTGGAPILSYAAMCSTAGLDAIGGASTSPIVVPGLANGRATTCRVTATNAYGSSATASAPSVTPSATSTLAVDPIASITLGAVNPSLAADGITAVVAQLRTASGALYAGADVTLAFASRCTATGQATIDGTAVAHLGTAAVTYQPRGCTGSDTVTASLAGGGLQATAAVVVSRNAALSAKAALGRSMFFDRALSAGNNVSCASCHAPANDHLAPDALPTPPGGVDGRAVGFRSAPTAAYAALAAPFRFLQAADPNAPANPGATGRLGTPHAGLMWDGRASDVVAQAQGPFTGPHEMANANSAAVLARLLARPYLASFQAVYGTTTSRSNPDTVLAQMADAIGQYETEDRSFMPFNSKFDAVQAGRASLTAQEANGQLLFFAAGKGACAACHAPFDQVRSAQSPAAFTDGAYRAIGVPRNWRLPYNVDATAPSALAALGLSGFLNGGTLGAPNHAFYDLGTCGPMRTDSLLDPGLCGAFRTPALRNAALKGSYFHNGQYGDLFQVIDFYLNREANPQALYLKADGTADVKYDDLPTAFQANVVQRPPFLPVPGGRLSAAERQDLVAFLCTLTDGYDPARPTAWRQPAQCSRAVRR